MRQIRAEGSDLNRQMLLPAERFIYSQTISGGLLVVCAIVALVWANSPWSHSYFALRDTPVILQIGTFVLSLDLQHWINDGLMAIFFFVMALEIKRELIYGTCPKCTRRPCLRWRVCSCSRLRSPDDVGSIPGDCTVAGVILGAITPAKSPGSKSSFIEALAGHAPERARLARQGGIT